MNLSCRLEATKLGQSVRCKISPINLNRRIHQESTVISQSTDFDDPHKSQQQEVESTGHGFQTQPPVLPRKRGNPNWITGAQSHPQNTRSKRTSEEDAPVKQTFPTTSPGQPNKRGNTKRQKISAKQPQNETLEWKNPEEGKGKNQKKPGRPSSTFILNEAIENMTELLDEQNGKLAHQNQLLLDQIGLMSDIKKLLVGFKEVFNQTTEVNFKYNREGARNPNYGMNEACPGTSAGRPGPFGMNQNCPGTSNGQHQLNTNFGMDMVFAPSFNWNL